MASEGDTGAGSLVPVDVVHNSSHVVSIGVVRSTGGSLERGGNPQVIDVIICRVYLSMGQPGYCQVCASLHPMFASHPVSSIHGVGGGGQGLSFLVGETSGFGENPLVGSEVQGFFPSGSFA